MSTNKARTLAVAATRDKTWLIGLIMTVFSAWLFYATPGFVSPSGDTMGIFFLNYFFVVIYFVVLLCEGRLKRGANGLAALFQLLILFLISAYALNREMSIFEAATGWWATVLVICCVNYLAIPFFEMLPRGWRHVVSALAGVSVMVFLYLMLYLFPLYAIGALGSPFLGISLHTFVPLLFFIYTIVFIRRAAAGERGLYITFWSAIGVIVLVVVLFICRWGSIVRTINRSYSGEQRELPAWVYAAQQSAPGPITERVLKTGLVYTVSDGRWDFFSVPRRNFGEEKKHDPLVVLATLVAGTVQAPEEDRVKMLEALYDSRHQAAERFWRGDDLVTDKVNTAVEIWPNQHLSYTEKTIEVTNKDQHPAWRDQQEAIYTFYLPEGGVVSSLSLWIDGKEQKGVLTSKGKADSAYKTIVGHESRDPSVVHWQEGNRVSVRVFPVIAGQSRQFKIGVTAPLEKWGTMLNYRDFYFDGPSPADAAEAIQVRSDLEMEDLALPYFLIPGAGSKETRSMGTHYEGQYTADWGFSFRDQGIGKEAFEFGGSRYELASYYKGRQAATFDQVYLDINRAWKKSDFETVLGSAKGKNVFVYVPGEGLVAVNAGNADRLFALLSQQQFSLFPLYTIADPARSLLISRCGPSSPTLGEIDPGSRFTVKTEEYFGRGQKLRLFSLGGELSPYLKTLKDYQVLIYDQGEIGALQAALQDGLFADDSNDEDRVVLEQAGIMISRQPVRPDSTGKTAEMSGTDVKVPDHLMRMYAYQRIMQRMGKELAAGRESEAGDSTGSNALVKQAQEAHIVTPVSSLVVLETQDDYKRFNIADSKDGLKNASLQKKGAVPEPAEWALILMVLGVIGFVLSRNRVNRKMGNA